jgi:chromosomal replication initiator protein
MTVKNYLPIPLKATGNLNMNEARTWELCIDRLKSNLSMQLFNTWILPLQVHFDDNNIHLLAPNRFVLEWVQKNYLETIQGYVADIDTSDMRVTLEIGKINKVTSSGQAKASDLHQLNVNKRITSTINNNFTFENFVEGKSNQLAKAAAIQISLKPGEAYNPLFIYGGTGLGKTHLMHAIGNKLINSNPKLHVLYLYATTFVSEMVNALQNGKITEFKQKYRTVNVLLLDDVQFFAGKEKTQEEFFQTFNHLFESQQQIVLTSDKYPKDINLEERLKSRFGWGLIVRIEPPDLETRVAILKKKSLDLFQTTLPDDVAFFIGKKFHANIRDIESALRRVIASTKFTGLPIDLDSTRLSLRDMLAAQDRQITLETVQKIVAEYYGIRSADLSSKTRSRNIARPRQIAMSLARELTNKSMPEIGKSFGGRDHTTVLYAVRKVTELRNSNSSLDEDYNNLLRTLTN